MSKPDNRTKAQRYADAVTDFCGSWPFVIIFSLFTFGWIIINTVLILVGKFDEYPFILLNLVLTIVSTMQSPLIMMSQNRQSDIDREVVHDLHAKLDKILHNVKED